MANYIATGTDLTAVANAIRTKGGTSESLSFPDGFISAIEAIPSGSTEISIIPEQTVTVSGSFTPIQFDAPLVVGETYSWSINGTTGTGTAISSSGDVLLIGIQNAVAFDYSSSSMYLAVSGSSYYGTYTIKVTQEASGPTLITKSITQNGTYSASSDSADGYSQVTVAVPVPPVVIGTFTPSNNEADSVKSITVPYTGNGYPVSCAVRPTAGTYKSGTDIYASTQQKAVVMYTMSKANAGETPDYSTSNIEKNQGTAVTMYKNSSSDATNIAPSGSKNALIFTSYNAGGNAAQNVVRFKSKTEMTVYVGGGSNYGFLAGTEYTYEITYSS